MNYFKREDADEGLLLLSCLGKLSWSTVGERWRVVGLDRGGGVEIDYGIMECVVECIADYTLDRTSRGQCFSASSIPFPSSCRFITLNALCCERDKTVSSPNVS